MTRYATITATGSYLPPIEVSNDTLRARLAHLPDYVDKMETATGIRKRWYAPDDWSTSDLAVPAAREALERAGKTSDDVDLIILGTDSPDFITPATSVVVQEKLQAKNAGTFDIGCACASFPTGLAAAAGLIATNASLRTVLVIGAYMMHRLADPSDPGIFFYGDGASAAVLEPAEKPGFISSAMLADGSYNHYWGIFAGGTAEPASDVALREGRTKVQIVKRYPPEVNEEGWPRVVRQLARDGDFNLEDVNLFIFTQVRKPTIEHVMSGLGLPMERAHTIMEDHGYTGSACVGMALDDAIVKGKLRPGGLVVMVGSGVGYNQAGVAFRMP
ncbi:MAG: ketoacyl-ACP synthase III [Candidatus Acidiferrales bacterium]